FGIFSSVAAMSSSKPVSHRERERERERERDRERERLMLNPLALTQSSPGFRRATMGTVSASDHDSLSMSVGSVCTASGRAKSPRTPVRRKSISSQGPARVGPD
ncbi:hypothetical protein KIPB_017053, partial [Kipferlia bialata]